MSMSHLYHSYSLVDLTVSPAQGRGGLTKIHHGLSQTCQPLMGPRWVNWVRFENNYNGEIFPKFYSINQSMITYMKLVAIGTIFSLWSLKWNWMGPLLGSHSEWVGVCRSEISHHRRSEDWESAWLYYWDTKQSQLMSSEKKIVCVLLF